jgi:hypothetical protein
MKPRVEAVTPGGGAFSRAGALKPVEACDLSWPHDWVEARERCFVALDFNKDKLLSVSFWVREVRDPQRGTFFLVVLKLFKISIIVEIHDFF